MDEEGQKEVVPPRQPQQQQGLPPGILGYRKDSDDSQKKTYCGLSRLWFLILLALAVIIILGVGLGAGLGVGLSGNDS
jgi:hypothetical protein